MRFAVISIAAFAFAATPALAGDAEDAYASVKTFIDGFNTGDVASSLAVCATSASIIDEFAPYAWSGEDACTNWVNDYGADSEKKGVTDGVVTLHEATHVFVEGDNAYVVAPVDYAFKVAGKPSGQKGSTLTAALAKQDGQWKITQWSWSTGKMKE